MDIYHLLPKNLTEHLDALSVFGKQINKRPDKDLYYSEILITNNQLHDYKNAIKVFQEIIERHEKNQQKRGNPSKT